MILDNDLVVKVSDATFTGYEVSKVNNEEEKIFISSEIVEAMLEDLVCEIEVLKEKYKDLQDDLENNYEKKEVDYYEEYGLNRNDF
jgi:hypothetical protein